MSYDVVIRGGTVVDGSGMAPYRSDVAINDDRIAKIGRIDEAGLSEIDADGHIVSPGFVDGHTHMDAQVFWDQIGSCSCWHGVTSVVMGNCGFTLAPSCPDAHDLVLSNLERAEDISRAAMAAGIDWTWESFPEYLDAVDAQPKAINYAAQIGHSALRTFVMGERAFEEAASEDDLEVMIRTLRDAIRAGAVGFSSSMSKFHLTLDDRPVASRRATWEEISRLVEVLGEQGAGVFELAPDEATMAPDFADAKASYDRLADLAVSTRVPITYGVRQQNVRDQLALFDATARRGGRMIGQTRSGSTSLIFSFKSGMPYDRLDDWKEFRAQPHAEQLASLRDPMVRGSLAAAVDAAYADGAATGMTGARGSLPPFGDLMVLREGEQETSVEGIAIARGVSPSEVVLDLALESNLNQVFARFFGWSADDLQVSMSHPRTVMTFSDSGAHVSYHSGAELQTNLLAEWVRERQVFSIEEAIRMMTLVPAMLWKLPDRGLLREGMIADINVFDLATVDLGVPTIETDLPAGATRVKQKAKGYLATLVGGRQTFQAGEHTGELPGRLIRGPLAGQRPATSPVD